MSTLTIGQAKVDLVTGLAGAMWTAWLADTDSTINALSAEFSPCPGSLTPQQIANRKNLASFIDAVATVMASFISYGSGTIAIGQSSVTIADTAVKANSVVDVMVNQAAPDAACNVFSVTIVPGVSVTITGQANTSAGVAIRYKSLNPV